MALDQWIQEGMESVNRASAPLPKEPVYFVFRTAGAKDALVGVFAPSNDRVGRVYPFVAYAYQDVAALGGRFSLIPLAYTRFLGQATELVTHCANFTGAQLADQARNLPLPGNQEFALADSLTRQALGNSSANELQNRLFTPLNLGKQYYAFRTLLDACATVQGKEPAKTNITIDCPVIADVDLFAWLDLIRRMLRWPSGLPPFFWTEGESPRLLVALGPAPSTVMLYLAKPDHTGAKLWPLQTDKQDALQRAQQNMSPPLRAAVDNLNVPLETLLASIAG